ncbi:MAG TPA: hypothetical protein VJJ52_06560 [Candidatus Nanoarchaeia archaeon]|nr:hypothetical protein [Candidatus Nanoarchaeia archaeon]
MQVQPIGPYQNFVIYREVLDTSESARSHPFNTVWVMSRGVIPEYFPSQESLVKRAAEITTTRRIEAPILGTIAENSEYEFRGQTRRMESLTPEQMEILFQQLSAVMPNLRIQ